MTPEEIKNRKNDLRRRMKGLNDSLPEDLRREYSEALFDKIEGSEEFRKARVIGMFCSLPDEPDTVEIIEKWSREKSIALPCISGNEMDFYKYENREFLLSGNYGIQEPQRNVKYWAEDLDLLIVPGVAFDVEGGRLGRGKGFYDRYLESCSTTTIGVCYPHQIIERVPAEPHDKKVDKIILI